MDLSYIVGFHENKKILHAGQDAEGVIINPGEQHIIDRINTEGYSYFRLQVNFNAPINPDNVRIRMKDVNRGSLVTSGAAGMEVDLPMQITTASGFTKRVLFTDGDIPLFNEDIFIKVFNEGNEPITLRNFTVRLLK